MLIVGNGLAMSLADLAPRLRRKWDTRHPLSWTVKVKRQGGLDLLDLIPIAKSAIADRKHANPHITDFEALRLIGELITDSIGRHVRTLHPTKSEQIEFEGVNKLSHDIRVLLSLLFSEYQLEADRHLTNEGWEWGKFVGSIASRLVLVASLNYDLNVETVLENAGSAIHHLALDDASAIKSGVVPIGKPHGSINYKSHGPWPVPRRDTYLPLQTVMLTNDFPIALVERNRLRVPRTGVDIVLPGEATQVSSFQWVKPLWEWAKYVGPRVRYLIVMGISYAVADRPEIDLLIDMCDPTAEAIVGDPFPSPDLLIKLRSRFAAVHVWSQSPKSIGPAD